MTRTTKPLIIVIGLFCMLWGCEECFRRKIGGFAGSYPFVETWKLNASEQDVVEAIKELKRENPSLRPPNEKEFTSTRDTGYVWESLEMIEYKEKLKVDSTTPLPEHSDQNSHNSDYWLYIDFYYPDTREVVQTWTRPDVDSTKTRLALVGFSDLNNPESSRLINRDFWYLANKKQINKFQKTIVDRIQEKLDRKKKSGT